MTPTPEGKQLAADLANALSLINAQVNWSSGQPWTVPMLETDAKNSVPYAVAVKLLTEALVDLREIDGLLENAPNSPSVIADAKAIAAKWRVETDPLVEIIRQHYAGSVSPAQLAHSIRAELSKRGYEIGRKS